MLCPICKINLVMSDRQGIEIDYCPQCRGVWLDRGELDKLLDKSSSHQTSAPSHSAPQYQQNTMHYQQSAPTQHHQQHNNDYKHQGHQKKKESWLGEIFDF